MATSKYRILKNEKFGRYMVAGKNLKAGELILAENPILVGSALDGPLICFGCCKNVYRSGSVIFPKCNTAILCSSNCAGKFHVIEECNCLNQLNISGHTLEENDQIIFPLRCLLLKQYNPKCWNTILELESHLDVRKDTAIWRRHQISVEWILKKLNILSDEDLKNELIQTICGILDVNTFEVRPPKCNTFQILNPEIECLRGLYLNAAMMAHDCLANTLLSVDDDFNLTIKASVDIPENHPIFFSYANVLHGSVDRKQHLREGKYFECSCVRCSDPSELKTDMSSLICHICRKGKIRVENPTNHKSSWKCSECNKKFTHYLVTSAVEEGRRRIQEIDQLDIVANENLLKTLLQTFHTNHFLTMQLKQNIIGLYARQPPNKKKLLRKITLCQEVLDVISIVEPGISRLKAMALYQLQSALIDLAHKEYNDQQFATAELIMKLLNAERKLKEAIKFLLHEPPRSPEGKNAQMAMSELKLLRTSIDNIQKDFLKYGENLNKMTKNQKGKKNEKMKMEKKPLNDGGFSLTVQNDIDNKTAKKSKKKNKNVNKKTLAVHTEQLYVESKKESTNNVVPDNSVSLISDTFLSKTHESMKETVEHEKLTSDVIQKIDNETLAQGISNNSKLDPKSKSKRHKRKK